jgi:hypothetical protein
MERAQSNEPALSDRVLAPPSASEPATTLGTGASVGHSTTGSFLYTRTRVFTPLADVLEDNRILNPALTPNLPRRRFECCGHRCCSAWMRTAGARWRSSVPRERR